MGDASQEIDVTSPGAAAAAPAPAPKRHGLVRAYNLSARGLARIGIARPVPTAEQVLRVARRRTRLDDFGDPDPREPLAVLLEAFAREARLHRFAQDGLTLLFSTLLAKRLRIVDWLKRHPEVLDAPVPRPMFVLGFPRTGTTLLFNLLAQDPEARALLSWQAIHPVPPRGYPHHRRDRRKAKLGRALRWMAYFNPDYRKVHEIPEDGPEECVPLLMRTLACSAFAAVGHIPSYERWLRQLDRAAWDAVYRCYRAQVQLVQWQQERPGGHRLHKSPVHLSGLCSLVGVFPDAEIVETHRDLGQVIPSACSLVALVRGIHSDHVEPHALGPRLLDGTRQALESLERARATIPPSRVFDVRFPDLMRDPIATVGAIYDHFGRCVSATMESGMARWLADNPRHKHGAHDYALEQFGLTRAQVDEAARGYHERFGLAEAPAAGDGSRGGVAAWDPPDPC